MTFAESQFETWSHKMWLTLNCCWSCSDLLPHHCDLLYIRNSSVALYTWDETTGWTGDSSLSWSLDGKIPTQRSKIAALFFFAFFFFFINVFFTPPKWEEIPGPTGPPPPLIRRLDDKADVGGRPV